jgi:hypothetical protein
MSGISKIIKDTSIEENILKCNTFNDLYYFIINLYHDIDFIAVNKEWITFISNGQFINYKKDVNFIDLPFPLNINTYMPLKYLSISNITNILLTKKFKIYSTDFQIFTERFTLFVNSNKILINLDKCHNIDFLNNLSTDKLLLLPKNINIDIDDFILKIENVSKNKYNFEKLLKCLVKFKNDINILNDIIANYDNVDILINILQKN